MTPDTKKAQAYLDACDAIRQAVADGVDPDSLLLYAYGRATGRKHESAPETATRKSIYELLLKSDKNAPSRSRRAV